MSKHGFTHEIFNSGVLFPIRKTLKCSIILPSSVNHEQVLMCIKYKANSMCKLHPTDYAVKNYIPSYPLSKVAVLSPTLYAPLHWVTCRFPVSPIWNLLGLFTKVSISLKCFFKVCKKENKTKLIHAGCIENLHCILSLTHDYH